MIKDTKSFRIQDIIFYNADFLKLDEKIGQVDLIITSPPYNIGIDYGVYDDSKTYQDYLAFSRLWLAKCYTILKNEGRICINIPLGTKDHSIAADMTILAKNTGFNYKGEIIWDKQSCKNKFAMSFSKNLEVILIFYKESWKPVKKEFRDYVNEIWKFSGENPKRVNHPAAFPMELPRRLIKMFSEIGETVLDPFSGSGTTMIASKMLLRKGIGVEIDEKYFEVSKDRLINKKF